MIIEGLAPWLAAAIVLGGARLSPLSPGKRWSRTLTGSVTGVGVLALLGWWSWPLAVALVLS